MTPTSIIQRYTAHPVTNDATFRELRLDGIDRMSIAHDIETLMDCELSQKEIDAWVSVADVARTVERVR